MRYKLICLLLMLNPLRVSAQSVAVSGAIEGTVVDATGAVIPGVRVTARQEESGRTRAVETDAAGRFHFAAVPIGHYTLRFEKPAFGTVSIKPFLVSVGQTVVQEVEMKPAALIETVEVREQAEALDKTAPTPSVALGYERVEEAPAQGRNYLNFVLVAPGVTASPGSSPASAGPTQASSVPDSGLIFAGMRGRSNRIAIDGVDNRDETTGGNRVAVGLEMVQEFRVSGVSVGAENGGAAGGFVDVVTRSGTNAWHGDATLFVRNELFNARRADIDSLTRPRFRRYQPGTSISGPLRKDRTFIAAAIEGEWESEDEMSDVPTGALGPINRALASPEFSRAGVRSGLHGIFPAEMRGTDASVKLDHQAGVHSFTARYALSRGRVSSSVQDVDNFSDRSARGSSLNEDHSFVAGWTTTPTAHFASDLRLQLARRTVELTPNATGPMLEIPGVVTLGQAYRLDGSRTEDHIEVVESANVIARGHQLSFGTDVHRVHLGARLANRFGGLFIFPTLDDFFARQPDVFLQAFGDPNTKMTVWPVGVWLQERSSPFTGLTLEVGVRYDHESLPAPFSTAHRNWAPRLGLAWNPGGRAPFVIRAGFGLFYDRFPLAFVNDALQKDGLHGFEEYLTGADAAAAFASSLGGPLPPPMDGVAPAVYRADPNFPSPYGQKFGVGFEYRLNKDTTLSAQYNNVRGVHLPRIRNVRGGLLPLYQLETTAKSSFQGGSVFVNRRMSHELSFLVDYDFGETWDDASDFDEQPLDPLNLRKDWAHSRQHQAHRVAASALFELPTEEWRGGLAAENLRRPDGGACPNRWQRTPHQRLGLNRRAAYRGLSDFGAPLRCGTEPLPLARTFLAGPSADEEVPSEARARVAECGRRGLQPD